MERRVLKAGAPRHVEYALTALGKTLEQPHSAICDWGAGGRVAGGSLTGETTGRVGSSPNKAVVEEPAFCLDVGPSQT
jgi:HxlR-like helix-turn-helix